MAWPYTQTFNGLTDGDLNGQDSWASDVDFDIQGVVTFEGAKAVEHTDNTESDIKRTVTGSASGNVSVEMRREGTGPNAAYSIFQGATRLTFFYLGRNSGADQGGISNVATTIDILTVSNSTFYTCEIEYDVSTDQYRGRIDGGTWTSWIGFYNGATATEVDAIQLIKQNGGTTAVYFDDIKDATPAAAETGFMTLQRGYWG